MYSRARSGTGVLGRFAEVLKSITDVSAVHTSMQLHGRKSPLMISISIPLSLRRCFFLLETYISLPLFIIFAATAFPLLVFFQPLHRQSHISPPTPACSPCQVLLTLQSVRMHSLSVYAAVLEKDSPPLT